MSNKVSFKYRDVPRFSVDLDADPSTRWNAIIDVYKYRCKRVLDIVELTGISGTVLSWIVNYYSTNVYYIEELKGISKRAEIPLDKLILMQLCYEMYSCCTSVIINTVDDTVHYRTMDWQMEGLNDLTIIVDFVKNGEILFSATSWAGYVGVMTGVKPGICTVALNFRRLGDGILTNLRKSVSGSWPVGFLIRHLMETEQSFEKIETFLKNSELISPCYLTISGPGIGKGSIISRTRSSTDKYKKLTQNENDFIVQTNIDFDKEKDLSVPNIVYSKQRIMKVNELMNNKLIDGKNLDKQLISRFDVWPIINETTIYVTTMRSSDGRMTAYY